MTGAWSDPVGFSEEGRARLTALESESNDAAFVSKQGRQPPAEGSRVRTGRRARTRQLRERALLFSWDPAPEKGLRFETGTPGLRRRAGSIAPVLVLIMKTGNDSSAAAQAPTSGC